MRGLRILTGVTVLVAVFGVGAFLYLTREIAAPSQDVQTSVQQLETSAAGSSAVVFRISQDESQVSYTIEEVLNGADKTVIGTTSEVAGDILLDLNDLSQSQIGDIHINARTFATDDERRDNTVARAVLQSETDEYEFITFLPGSISGLPGSASVGDSLTFQVTGDLTIAGVTQEITFDVSAALESAERLAGQAEVVVAYADFNITIPEVPFVASVEDTVTLTLDFVANAVSTPAAET